MIYTCKKFDGYRRYHENQARIQMRHEEILDFYGICVNSAF